MYSRDTSPEAEALQLSLLRDAPVWKRLRLAGEMSIAVMQLARLGVKRRNPYATKEELRRLEAEALLGSDLATRIFGAPATRTAR